MKRIFLFLLIPLSIFLIACSGDAPPSLSVPVTSEDTSEFPQGVIPVGSPNKVVALSGGIGLGRKINHWIDEHPENTIISISVIPHDTRGASATALIVYE